jgi:hypothetical protein
VSKASDKTEPDGIIADAGRANDSMNICISIISERLLIYIKKI